MRGCNLLIRYLPRSPRSLRSIRVARAGSGLTFRASTGRDPGASESSESLDPGRAYPRAPCPGLNGLRRIRVAGLGEESDAAVRGAAGSCTHRIRHDAKAVRPGSTRLAGRSVAIPYQGPEGRNTLLLRLVRTGECLGRRRSPARTDSGAARGVTSGVHRVWRGRAPSGRA